MVAPVAYTVTTPADVRETFRRAREDRRLSQRALAREARVAAGTVRAFEDGEKLPTLGVLLKLAAVLGISLAVIYLAGKGGGVGGAVAP